ncbi:Coenzyme PQQ synthesis protein D (PqqD) [Seinonella peptonophila]|uniref:Coenzyme PQQ synthesis protein D (PqqD) n=1 Tax=Seinonella peptonophila TaxID=112248 RepID=A0A1M4W8D2_9BACL|nr:PqqD family protein [Seinonella peptonophila]SHE77420.1 Coenzyme PQQ synthesis protein D (PqqD) [Seinonella peptonophila]
MKDRVNFLHLSPVLNHRFRLESIDGIAMQKYLVIPRTNLLERFLIRWLKQPAVRIIELDELGSFVVEHCDGQKTVEQIATELENRFGEQVKPTIPRLLTFLQQLEAYGWIDLNLSV